MENNCKNCFAPIRKIPFLLGEKWMHVDLNAGFPTTAKGTLWEYCKMTVAEPKDNT